MCSQSDHPPYDNVVTDSVRRSRTVDDIWRHTLERGGGTFDALSLYPVEPINAWAVGQDAGYPTVSIPHPLTNHNARDAFGRAIIDALEAGSVYVGTWKDDETGSIDVDAITLIEDTARAVRTAIVRGERAIYHLESGVTLRIDTPDHARSIICSATRQVIS